MSATTHSERTSRGMLADSDRRGARRKYSRSLAIARRYGIRAVQIMLGGTRCEIEVLAADISRALPDNREKEAMLCLLRYSAAYIRFRSRNLEWVEGNIYPIPETAIPLSTVNEVKRNTARNKDGAK